MDLGEIEQIAEAAEQAAYQVSRDNWYLKEVRNFWSSFGHFTKEFRKELAALRSRQKETGR